MNANFVEEPEDEQRFMHLQQQQFDYNGHNTNLKSSIKKFDFDDKDSIDYDQAYSKDAIVSG